MKRADRAVIASPPDCNPRVIVAAGSGPAVRQKAKGGLDEGRAHRRRCSCSLHRALSGTGCCSRRASERLCSPCHEIGLEAKVKLGPPLNGIEGRKAGTFEGYSYSQANKSSGITWDEQSFPTYIHAPMQKVPGTKMAFVGMKNDKDIADLWAYLKQFGPDGQKK
jgi:cytochrome c